MFTAQTTINEYKQEYVALHAFSLL